MRGKIIGVVLTLVIVGIILLSIFVVTTQNEIKEINEEFEEIKNKPISLKILADTSSGISPLTVNFKSLLLNNKNQVKYNWDFGDGNTSNEKEPTNIYKKSGSYNCILTVQDGDITVSDFYNITVFQNNPPKVKILCNTIAYRPERVYFDAEVFDPEGDELEYKWKLVLPPIMSAIKLDQSFNTKNFSKLFIRCGRYVAELTVTDEAGNQVTDYEIVQVRPNQIGGGGLALITLLGTQIPNGLNLIWTLSNLIFKYEENLDKNWFDKSDMFRFFINIYIALGNVNYEPPIPKADLRVSEIQDLNLSYYVNDTTRIVENDATVNSSFTITNIDNSNISKNIYITLDHPLNKDEGLIDDIEIEDLYVGLDVGVLSNKLFFNRVYTRWQDCYDVEKLVPGEFISMDLFVTLKKGATIQKGSYDCKLFMYQEKSLKIEKYVDEIPFTIIL